ncbi:MAG: response regulator [Clostridiales bacterium]|jgi:two-component system response regulator YesN|nr:response regulator [Clostridiales bacterium]
MEFYRILLVDDEEEIREGIIHKIDWESLGYQIAGSAENGLEALEKAERLHPDVVITDIKMPFMNGLDLGEKLQAVLPSVKLIFFSGFDDFEFAQRAIKLHAVEYVLKPIDSTELAETLKKVKHQLDCELNEKRNVELLRKSYEKSLPVMREQFLVGLMEGRIPKENIQNQAALFHIDPEARGWAVALLFAGPVSDDKAVFDNKLIPISLKCAAEETLKNYCRSFLVFIYSDCVTVIAGTGPESEILSLVDGVNEVCKSEQRVLGTRVTGGVSTVVPDLMLLKRAYREAQTALEYSAVVGGDRAIYVADVEPDTSAHVEFDDADEREITNAVKLASEEEIRQRVRSLFERFESVILPLGQYQIFLMELTTSLIKLLRAYGLDEAEIFGKSYSYPDIIQKLYSPEDMMNWCADICVTISTTIKRQRVHSAKLLAQNAQAFIHEHYSDPGLSVKNLCQYLHVSSAYFSTVFKRETGTSFVSYLTDTRLKKAVSLLNATQDKTYIIAQKVGFEEPNYFSYVFKKQFGVSPSKYRNQ